MEDSQQGRKGGQHGEYGQTEVVAERSLGVIQVRQRDEECDDQYFQPEGHGCAVRPAANLTEEIRQTAAAVIECLSRRVTELHLMTNTTDSGRCRARTRANVLREPASVYFCLVMSIITLHRL